NFFRRLGERLLANDGGTVLTGDAAGSSLAACRGHTGGSSGLGRHDGANGNCCNSSRAKEITDFLSHESLPLSKAAHWRLRSHAAACQAVRVFSFVKGAGKQD